MSTYCKLIKSNITNCDRYLNCKTCKRTSTKHEELDQKIIKSIKNELKYTIVAGMKIPIIYKDISSDKATLAYTRIKDWDYNIYEDELLLIRTMYTDQSNIKASKLEEKRGKHGKHNTIKLKRLRHAKSD